MTKSMMRELSGLCGLAALMSWRKNRWAALGFSTTSGLLLLSQLGTGESFENQSVVITEALVTLNLTGGKTWHRLAPFVGLAGGLAFSSDVPADTSGYDFGTKFFFAPAAGTRVFFSSRLHLRAEFRANFWRLNYPLSFRQEPDPVIITGRDSEWDLSPWVLFGFGYTL